MSRNTRYEYPADDEIDPAEITICKRPDGSDWCLGGGQYGKARAQELRTRPPDLLLLAAVHGDHSLS